VAYARAQEPMTMHIDYTKGGRRMGEWILAAEYYVLTDQPPASVMRDNVQWRKWCVDRHAVANGLFPRVAPSSPPSTSPTSESST
jgi:hypothetical protein